MLSYFVQWLDKVLCLAESEEKMALRIFQKGFNYSQDGPGNRLVYHLQGCNMACPWCANPEGLALSGGEEYSVESLVGEVLRSRMMFFDSGGVTLTGGEVTMQFGEVKELLFKLHDEKIHTCIETNATSPRLSELFSVVDYLIADIKHYDAEVHKGVTGVSNDEVIGNLRLAIESGAVLALRIPLIGGFNATSEDAKGFCRLFDFLGINENVTLELLPYHEYGKDKYKKLGMEYVMGKGAFVPKERIREIEKIFSDYGIKLIKT